DFDADGSARGVRAQLAARGGGEAGALAFGRFGGGVGGLGETFESREVGLRIGNVARGDEPREVHLRLAAGAALEGAHVGLGLFGGDFGRGGGPGELRGNAGGQSSGAPVAFFGGADTGVGREVDRDRDGETGRGTVRHFVDFGPHFAAEV